MNAPWGMVTREYIGNIWYHIVGAGAGAGTERKYGTTFKSTGRQASPDEQLAYRDGKAAGSAQQGS